MSCSSTHDSDNIDSKVDADSTEDFNPPSRRRNSSQGRDRPTAIPELESGRFAVLRGDMVCYNFYVFDRNGVCLYYHEWQRSKSVRQGAGSRIDEEKQLFGLIWTLKNLTSVIDPKQDEKPRLGAPMKIGEGCSYRSFRTNVYRCHFLESLSGLKFVMNTSPEMESMVMNEVLKEIYSQIYVECVVKNPMYVPNSKFDFESVTEQLNAYMKRQGLIP